jgi:general secretion pathway protein B
MSYILDALKKAERERGLTQVPTLSTVHDLRTKPPIRLWVVSGFSALCIALCFWFFFIGLNADDGVSPSLAERSGNISNRPDAKQTNPPMPVAGSSLPARSSGVRTTPDADYSREIRSRVDNAGIAVPGRVVQEPIMDERRVVPSVPPPTADRVATQDRTAAVPRSNINASDVSPDNPTGSLPTRPRKTMALSEESKSSPDATGESEIPLADAVDEMSMSILLYSENKAERLVFINGRKYVEGDTIEGKYLLENITPEGAVLSYREERAMLRAGRN